MTQVTFQGLMWLPCVRENIDIHPCFEEIKLVDFKVFVTIKSVESKWEAPDVFSLTSDFKPFRLAIKEYANRCN